MSAPDGADKKAARLAERARVAAVAEAARVAALVAAEVKAAEEAAAAKAVEEAAAKAREAAMKAEETAATARERANASAEPTDASRARQVRNSVGRRTVYRNPTTSNPSTGERAWWQGFYAAGVRPRSRTAAQSSGRALQV